MGLPRHSLRLLAAGLLAATGTLAAARPAPAAAAALDVTCTPPSSQVDTYSPPLTTKPQDVSNAISRTYGPCVSAADPALTSGSSTFTVTDKAFSCLDLLAAHPATFTITWNTGATSTVVGNAVPSVAGAVHTVLVTGTVTSGEFAGDTVVENSTGAATSIARCTLRLGTVSSTYLTVTLLISSA